MGEMQAQHRHQCICAGVYPAGTSEELFAVLSDAGCQVQAPTRHGERMRKAEHLSKNWI